jgi:hypothetical protein
MRVVLAPLPLLILLIVLMDDKDTETDLPPPSSSRPTGPVDLRMLWSVGRNEYECCGLW